MKCPNCGKTDTSVVDSRVTREGREIRRRRECVHCNSRFTTYERSEERTVFIVKKDKRRESFNIVKLTNGLRKACEKIEITSKQIDNSAMQIKRRINDLNLDEVNSKIVGKYVMEALYDLDEVAYIRFSSVYLRFKDISEFTDHIKQLRLKKKHEAKKDARKKT